MKDMTSATINKDINNKTPLPPLKEEEKVASNKTKNATAYQVSIRIGTIFVKCTIKFSYNKKIDYGNNILIIRD